MALFWDILFTQKAKFQIWYLSEFLVVLWPKYVVINKTTLGIHKNGQIKISVKIPIGLCACANLINLQKNDKQTVFEVYLALTMPLNHVFRFLFKYGGWYLNCTYNYVCSPTEYENIWTNMSKYNSSVTLLTHAHFVSTTHIHNITSICLLFFGYTHYVQLS